MLELHQVRYTRADLDNAPENERVLHLMLGQLGNDINLMRKQLLYSINSTEPPDHQMRAAAALAMLTARLLAGRLYEAWNLLRSKDVALIIREYRKDFLDEAIAAHKSINVYFAKDNIIKALRQKVAFHTDFEVAKAAYARLPVDEIMTDYLTEHRGD